MKANPEIIEAFNEWQTKRGGSINLGEVEFDFLTLKALHVSSNIRNISPTSANRFIEISDIDEATKEYDLTKKVKHNLPLRAKSAPKETILISRVRPLLGSYTIIKDNGYAFTSGDLNPISLRDDMDVKYVFSAICSPVFRKFLQENQSENGQKPTITSKLYDFAVLVPAGDESLAIQKEIVAFIENQQAKIHGWTEAASKLIDGVDDFGNLLLAKMFQPEKSEDLVELFNHWQSKRGGSIDLGGVEFEEVNIFQVLADEGRLLGPKKLESSQPEILANQNNSGIPVYSGKNGELCKVLESQYQDKVFESEAANPSISFASNGDGSAGRNFVVHQGKFFINQERTLVDFRNYPSLFSRYVLYAIRDMREIYNMNQQHRATPTDLPGYGMMIPIPKGGNSLGIQKEIVAFIEAFENWRADVHYKFRAFRSLSEEYEKIFLAKMFHGDRE